MFFIMGMSPREKQIPYKGELIICPECGKYGRYEVFMTCMCFSMFFIPLFRWNRQYIVRANCCGTLYQLDPEIGRAVERGSDVQILPEHLTKISNGTMNSGGEKTCGYCGYKTTEDFQFCPKCGRPF